MIVIADTSPINYLIVIGEIDVLPKLFDDVVIPKAVFNELAHEKAPTIVNEFILNKPEWLSVQDVEILMDVALAKLGRGERQAIALAEKLRPDFSRH